MARLYLSLGMLVLAALSFALVLAEPLSPWKTKRYARFDVRASESNGSVLLDWDPNSPVVIAANSGVLESVDGGVPHRDTVTTWVLRKGGLEYRRRSNDASIRLMLVKDNQTIGQAVVKLTGPPTLINALQ